MTGSANTYNDERWYNFPSAATTSATATASDDWNYIKIGTACQRLYTYFETTNQRYFDTFRLFGDATQQWTHGTHEPWKYIYVPGEDIEDLLKLQNEQLTDLQRKAFATQHLAPIDEAVELEGFKRVTDHLEKLLNDEAYRTFQLTEINKVNKILGVKECTWNVGAVQDKLGEIKGYKTPRKAWQVRGMKHLHQLAEKRAEELFNDVFTAEEIMKLNTDKRLLISRGDLAFELTADGGINQLLPNGEKQGWCLVSKEYGLALKDILVMKKLILESAPEIVLQVANKRSPFN